MMQLRIDLLSELGLYRKCVKICEEILSNSEGLQPRAALLLSRSYLKLNRLAECKDTAHLALKGLTASDDVYTARYLQILSEGVDQFPEPISSPSKAQIIDDRTSGIEIHSKRLQDLQQKYLGNGPGQVAEPLARMVMRDLSYATGDEAVDMLLVLGNAQMNYGNIAPAIEIFEGVLKCNDLVLAAHLGLGSALALTGQFDTAVEHFTRAISIDPTIADAWKRRGQTRAAASRLKDALNDYLRASSLTARDPDIYFQIGVVHYRMNNFQLGRRYVEKAIAGGEISPEAYNSLGMCCAQLGDVTASLTAYGSAIQLKPAFVDSIYNSGIISKENGDARNAELFFQRCISISMGYTQAYYSLGVLKYSMGQYSEASDILSRHVSMTSRADVASISYLALSQQCLGRYSRALKEFNNVIESDGNGTARTQREILLYLWRHLNAPFKDIDIDAGIAPFMKDAWCKKCSWEVPFGESSTSGSQPLSAAELKILVEPADTHLSAELDAFISALAEAADDIGKTMQLQCPGFLPNARQHRMFGVASIHMAAALRAACATPPCPDNCLQLSWRNLFGIASCWRQISEPNDAVWWIDGFSQCNFEDGFGLETPMVQGQLRVIRYYNYFSKAFGTVKDLLCTHHSGNTFPETCCFAADGVPLFIDGMESLIASASTPEDLWHAVGQDFYVITRYQSLVNPTEFFEGTRITLLASYPDGFKFTIRTPGTPGRWAQFDRELSYLTTSLLALLGRHCTGARTTDTKVELLKLALKFFYVWVIFAPLSRGSAVCGYACLHSILLAGGFQVMENLPKDIQLDWEAILAPSIDDFVELALITWLNRAIVPVPASVSVSLFGSKYVLSLFSSSADADLKTSGAAKYQTTGDIYRFFETGQLRHMLYTLSVTA